MIRPIIALLLFLCINLPALTLATDATHTHRLLPQDNKQFVGDAINFMQYENADRYKDMFSPIVFSTGGSHATIASLTSPTFATKGYTTDGLYVNQVTATITYLDNRTYCWVILDSAISGNLLTFTRVAGTHYMIDCGSGTMQPTLPSTSAWLMRVKTAAGAITEVLRLSSPYPLLSNNMSDGKNVKECGAVVDDVADDTVALNNCLATYSRVFVPQGKLKHSGTIIINPGNHLDGVWTGADAVILTDAAALSMAALTGSSLHYTGTGDAISASTASPNAITFGCRISNLLIYSGTGINGIHLRNLTDCSIDSVIVTGQTYPLTTLGFSHALLYLHMDVGALLLGDVSVTRSRFVYGAGYGVVSGPGNNTNGISFAYNHIQGNPLGGVQSEGQSFGWDWGGNIIEGNGNHQLYAQYAAGWNMHGNYSEPGAGNTNDVWLFERGTGLSIIGNRVGGGASAPVCIARFGTLATGQIFQGLTISNNLIIAASSYAWCLELVRGADIRLNVARGTVPAELGPATMTVEGLSYQEMTRESPTVSTLETTPTTVCQDVTSVAISNSAAETTIYSCLVKAHTMRNWREMGGLILALRGAVTNIFGPADLTIRTKIGAVTLSALRWQAVAVNGSPRAFVLRGEISPSSGTPGNQGCWFEGLLGAGDTVKNTVIDSGATDRLGACNEAVAGVNLAIDQTITVTAQFSVADANLSFNKFKAYFTRIGY